MVCINKNTMSLEFAKQIILLLVLINLLPYQLFTQPKCDGILGNPTVNINFGAGSNPGSPYSAVPDAYSFVGNDCPNDGTYTIINNSEGCFFGDWHKLTKDHTGDANGYFLLLNSSALPNEFFIDTIKSLCASTTYQLSAWVLNMNLPNTCLDGGVRPNLTFTLEKINGELVDSFTTNNIEPTLLATWQEFKYLFSTTETSLVLKISNNNSGGCGGDFAIDDIAFKPCIADVKINANSSTNDKPSIAKYHCENEDTTFIFSSRFYNIYENIEYLWQSSTDSGQNWINIPGANSDTLTQYFAATKSQPLYLYKLIVGEKGNLGFATCVAQSNIDSVVTALKPVSIVTTNSPVCENDRLLLSASGGSFYEWFGPAGFTATGNSVSINNTKLENSGIYQVKITSNYGCEAQDSMAVIINPSPKASVGADVQICEGANVQLSGNGGDTYSWSPSIGLSNPLVANPNAHPTITTRYSLTVANTFNCTDTASMIVNVLQIPIANAGSDKNVASGGFVKLDGVVSGFDISYYWSPNMSIDDITLIQPLVNPTENIMYTLHAASNQGCGSSTDDVNVTVIKTIEIPNVFSPNNDGINDTWAINNISVYNAADVSVFNRYGQKVFTSRGYYIPWNGNYNGQPLPIGTYYYIISIKTPTLNYQGSITIIR